MINYPFNHHAWESTRREINSDVVVLEQGGLFTRINTKNDTYLFSIKHDKLSADEKDTLISFMDTNTVTGFTFTFLDNRQYFCYPVDKAIEWVRNGAVFQVTTYFKGEYV